MRIFPRTLLMISTAICADGISASANEPAPRYVPLRSTIDPQFFTSIERVGHCEIKGDPIADTARLRVGPELYPPDSARNHEEGTVHLQLVFDDDWCVRKASVVKSSGFWRLDAVSLEYAIKLKWKPPKPVMIDGVATVEIPIAWGASQGKGAAK